jgi:uncharacterized membrane protein YhaH (DUF805 family)
MRLKLPKRLDRPAFWMWPFPLIVGHLFLAVSIAAGLPGSGTIDTVIVIFLAGVLVSRFRDIGWPGWIGPSFMVVTMVLFPLAAAFYAGANKLPPDRLMELLSRIGLIAGPLNLLLVVVAGSVPGKARIDATAIGEGLLLPAQAAGETTSVLATRSDSKVVFLVGAGGVLAVFVIGLFIARGLAPNKQFNASPSSSPQVAPLTQVSPSPQVRPNTPQGEVEANGLTKSTNDFLRQLSNGPAPARSTNAPPR